MAKLKYIVRTKSGKLGAIKRLEERVNGKVPVYMASEMDEKNEFPKSYSENAMLCDGLNIRVVGFID